MHACQGALLLRACVTRDRQVECLPIRRDRREVGRSQGHPFTDQTCTLVRAYPVEQSPSPFFKRKTGAIGSSGRRAGRSTHVPVGMS